MTADDPYANKNKLRRRPTDLSNFSKHKVVDQYHTFGLPITKKGPPGNGDPCYIMPQVS
jgi:hypothetical protein